MMELDMIREMLCTELKKYNTLKSINRVELDNIHMLSDTIKNLDKIKMLGETTKTALKPDAIDMMSEEDKIVIRRALDVLSRQYIYTYTLYSYYIRCDCTKYIRRYLE